MEGEGDERLLVPLFFNTYKTLEIMSNYEKAKKDAQNKADMDISNGLPCDPGSWGAKEGSAFDTWYTGHYHKVMRDKAIEGYKKLESNGKLEIDMT
jgi:hypothetical protein